MKSHKGESPIFYAIKVENIELIELLLDGGWSSLILAIKKSNLEIVQLLLERGVGCKYAR
ncbi:ankyrin repeat domain-containing protein [Spiroplasma endosymbiont of Asaphidion curtum]|uniref:ankyrin repeat domain-containing protein n=1 Tax=Spiroplasma endosymbiont of Asaphidion curtum TaxID=3066281 RepID=UPI00313BBD1C